MIAADLARYRAGQPVDTISNDLDARNWGGKIADPTVIAKALADLHDGVGNGMSGGDIFDKATVALRSPDPLVRGQVMALLTLASTTDRERLHGFLQTHADPATWTHYQQNIRRGVGRYMTSVAPDLTHWLRARNDNAGPQLGWLMT